METSQSIGNLSKALAKAQGEIGGATKDSTNPHFRSKYADLASVRDAIKGPLSANGIAYVQFTEGGPDTVKVTTMLTCGEEWMRSTCEMKPVKADPQGIGSALTYLRRYSLMAAVGVAPEDDDGNAASGKHPNQPANNGNLKMEANRIAEEIESCGDREQLQAYMATSEVKDFLKRAEEDAKRHSGINLADLTNQRFHDRNDKLPERKAPGKVEQILPEYTKMVDDAYSWIDTAGSPEELKMAGDAIANIKGKLDPKDKNDLKRAYEARARVLSQKEAA